MTKVLARVLTALLVLSTALATVSVPPATAGESITAEGVVHSGLYSDQWEAGADLNALAAATGKRVTFSGTFHNLYESSGSNWAGNTDWLLEQAWSAQSTPVMNISIDASAATIASGAYDNDIRAWAQLVKAWLDKGQGRSAIIAPLQEMNGNWTPYGMDPANFKTSFRKFRDIFRSLGMDETKIRWAYAPNGWSTPGYGLADYYPGADVVDVIGISAYNFGTTIPNASWESVPQVLGPYLTELRAFASDKPYLIIQTGSSQYGGDRNAWLRDLFSYTAADPNVIGLVYFNLNKTSAGETDWRIWNGSTAAAGWRDGMQAASTRHQWPLTSWFQPGPLPFNTTAVPPVPVCPEGASCDVVAMVSSGAQYKIWSELVPGAPTTSFFYGNPGDVALMGDWDGDGIKTPAMYRPTNGFMYLRNSNTQGTGEIEYFYGDPSDVPLAGDWDGDGDDTLAIYRPHEGKFYIKNTLGTGIADYSFYFGNPGDKPFVGDFNGDGTDTVGLHRASTGYVYFRNTNTTGPADLSFFYGDPGDKILAGDWNGNGTDTVAVYRPSTGTIYFNNTNAAGQADHSLTVGTHTYALIATGQ